MHIACWGTYKIFYISLACSHLCVPKIFKTVKQGAEARKKNEAEAIPWIRRGKRNHEETKVPGRVQQGQRRQSQGNNWFNCATMTNKFAKVATESNCLPRLAFGTWLRCMFYSVCCNALLCLKYTYRTTNIHLWILWIEGRQGWLHSEHAKHARLLRLNCFVCLVWEFVQKHNHADHIVLCSAC
jgi:hypothetical protein